MRRGMTLAETLIIAAGLAVVLAVAALGISHIRSDLKRHQTLTLLAQLNTALDAYHEATGTWPALPASTADTLSATPIGTVSVPILELIATVPAAREILDGIDPILHVLPIPDPEPTTDAGAWGTVRDGWGQPLRCLTTDASTPADREAVIAQDGKPVFISAGPDRRFGLNDVRFTADNLRSDERHTPDN